MRSRERGRIETVQRAREKTWWADLTGKRIAEVIMGKQRKGPTGARLTNAEACIKDKEELTSRILRLIKVRP